MEIHPTGKPIFRFSLFEAWWQNKQSAMKRYFPSEPESISTRWMSFGTQVAKALEMRPIPEWVAHLAMPQYDLQEYRIIEDVEGYFVRGTLDRYSTELHKILDDKCAKTVWSEKKAQKHLQLDFYSVLVRERHEWVDDESYIHCIPIDEDENGIIRFTGEQPVLLPHITTEETRNALRKKLVATAEEITTCWASYKKGYITL
jgi:hypothetical protein